MDTIEVKHITDNEYSHCSEDHMHCDVQVGLIEDSGHLGRVMSWGLKRKWTVAIFRLSRSDFKNLNRTQPFEAILGIMM